jgi:hypothetical protein
MDQEHLHEAVIANDALILLRGHACPCMILFVQQRFTQKVGPTCRLLPAHELAEFPELAPLRHADRIE